MASAVRARAAPSRAELAAHIGKLLVADELAISIDDVVAGLKSFDFFLLLAHLVLQLLEVRGQRLRDLPGGIGPHLRLFLEIGLRDGVGDAHGLVRIPAGDADVHDKRTFGAFHLDAALEFVQRGERGVGGKRVLAHQLRQQRWTAYEFRIVVEIFRSDDPAQHRVGTQHLDLALDLHERRVAHLVRLCGLAADGAQVGRVDEDLRCRCVLARRHKDEQHGQRKRRKGRGDDRPFAPPDGGTDPAKIDLALRGNTDADADVAGPDGYWSDVTRRFEHLALDRLPVCSGEQRGHGPAGANTRRIPSQRQGSTTQPHNASHG